jgi:hypothetical protein
VPLMEQELLALEEAPEFTSEFLMGFVLLDL